MDVSQIWSIKAQLAEHKQFYDRFIHKSKRTENLVVMKNKMYNALVYYLSRLY